MQLLTVDGTTGGREFQTPEEKGLSQLLLFFFLLHVKGKSVAARAPKRSQK